MEKIGPLVVIIAVGFLWILVWMVTEHVATYGKDDVLYYILMYVEIMSMIEAVVVQIIVGYILGPMLSVMQGLACTATQIFSPGSKSSVCDNNPGFNPPPLPDIDFGRVVPDTWDKLQRMQSTCAEFSNGPEVYVTSRRAVRCRI